MPKAQQINKLATIRDFSGGWNVSDSQYNLSSKYQPVSENVIVGVDGALQPRFGYKLFKNLRSGTETVIAATFTITSVVGDVKAKFNWVAHPFNTGDHITVPRISLANLPSPIEGVYSVEKVDANSFYIYLRTQAATAATSATQNKTVTRDTHVLSGKPIEAAFFQGKLLVFDEIGEIASIDVNTGVATRIWDIALAKATTGAPLGWRRQAGEVGLAQISYDTFKQTMIVVNGRLNDKPIEISFTRPVLAPVQFLVDPATTSNSAIYPADLVQSFDGYILMYAAANASGANTETAVDISAKNTSGVFVGNTAPDDAVSVDLGRVTQTVDPRITGAASIRDKVFVAFYDSAMLGKIGIYNGALHEPDFSDQVPQHGSLNNRVIVNVGNDLLMCDYAGVPAFSLSQTSGVVIPERLSQLIDPELNKHLSRLSQSTLRYKVWSLFNVRDRQYMLFVPKHDASSVFNGATDPFFVTEEFRTDPALLVHAPNHTVSVGDYVDVVGAAGFTGITAANLNGRRRVTAVVDKDYFFMEVGATPTAPNVSGGGGGVTFTPVDDETITYVYQYHPALRIKRWTRFRQWYFTCGTLSVDGRVFFCSPEGKVWQLGTSDKPIYADKVGDAAANADLTGVAINWAAETPWSDFKDRMAVKVGNQILFDAQGTETFTFMMFVDNIYDDRTTYVTAPASLVSMSSAAVVGGDAFGFGGGDQAFGLGKRAREQFNYHFPWRCKIAKMRFQGSTKGPLRIVSVSLQYQKGSIYR